MFGKKKMEEKPQDTELYRVGITNDNKVTLTIRDNSGVSLTLTMNTPAVRHMIRMLEVAIVEEPK